MNKKLRHWHRWVGMIVSLSVILLVITGIFLNHTDSLKLESKYVNSKWLLGWYGLKPVRHTVQYRVGDKYLVQVGKQLYLGRKRILRSSKPLIGAVTAGQFVVAGFRDKIVLLNRKGELVETINGFQGLPSPLKRLGYKQNTGLMLATTNGSFRFDLDALKSMPVSGVRADSDWVNKARLPAGLRTFVVNDYQNYRLSWERVLLDLHSGRLFGSWGVYLVDLFALLLLSLGISGWVVWWRSRRRRNKMA